MLDFNTSFERYNSNGYRTPFIFILGSILTLVVRLPGVPGSPRRTRRRLPGIPGSKENKNFFFKMFNGKDSDMFVVIAGQYCSA